MFTTEAQSKRTLLFEYELLGWNPLEDKCTVKFDVENAGLSTCRRAKK